MASWSASFWARFSGKMTLRLNWSFHLKEHKHTVAWKFNTQSFCPLTDQNQQQTPRLHQQIAYTRQHHQVKKVIFQHNSQRTKRPVCVWGKENSKKQSQNTYQQQRAKTCKGITKESKSEQLERTKQLKKTNWFRAAEGDNMTKCFEDQTEHKETRHLTFRTRERL